MHAAQYVWSDSISYNKKCKHDNNVPVSFFLPSMNKTIKDIYYSCKHFSLTPTQIPYSISSSLPTARRVPA